MTAVQREGTTTMMTGTAMRMLLGLHSLLTMRMEQQTRMSPARRDAVVCQPWK